MPEDTQFSPDSINDAANQRLLKHITNALKILNHGQHADSLVSEINTAQREKVFSDMLVE